MRGTPDFLRPVDRLAVLVEQGANLHDHGRRLRLVDEFFLASPAHADRLTRLLHRDDRGVGRRIIGAVVAVTARALHVMDDDRGRLELERLRQGRAQRINALAVGPNRQLAVLVKRKAARGRDRRVREIAARIRSLQSAPGLADRPARRAEDAGRPPVVAAASWLLAGSASALRRFAR